MPVKYLRWFDEAEQWWGSVEGCGEVGHGTCLVMVLSLSRPSDGPAGIRILLVMSGPEAGRGVGLRLLGNTSVTLFHRMGVLVRAVAALQDAGYHVVRADASRWLTVKDMHRDLARMLDFPGYYGGNLDAFNDCMRDVVGREYGFPEDAAGLVVVLTGFDGFAREFPDTAHGLLDLIAVRSRGAMLDGEQVICLVQSDDPRLSVKPVGATPVMWNDAEWLNSNRGL